MAASGKPLIQKRNAWYKSIQTGAILKRLNDHVLGKQEMSVTQIQACKILLAKTVPDMKAIEHSGQVALAMPDAVEWRKR